LIRLNDSISKFSKFPKKIGSSDSDAEKLFLKTYQMTKSSVY